MRDGNSLYRWCAESVTPHIVDTESFLENNLAGDSPFQGYAESATLCTIDSGELIFDYEYLDEFEAKIEKALTVV